MPALLLLAWFLEKFPDWGLAKLPREIYTKEQRKTRGCFSQSLLRTPGNGEAIISRETASYHTKNCVSTRCYCLVVCSIVHQNRTHHCTATSVLLVSLPQKSIWLARGAFLSLPKFNASHLWRISGATVIDMTEGSGSDRTWYEYTIHDSLMAAAIQASHAFGYTIAVTRKKHRLCLQKTIKYTAISALRKPNKMFAFSDTSSRNCKNLDFLYITSWSYNSS